MIYNSKVIKFYMLITSVMENYNNYQILFLLFLGMFTIGGCAGGGHASNPTFSYDVSKPLIITVDLSVWGAGSSNIERRYTNVTFYYKIGESGNFSQVPMQLIKKRNSKGTWKAELPANIGKPGEIITYYITDNLDGYHNEFGSSETIR